MKQSIFLKKDILINLIPVFLIISFYSCTKKFESYNSNPTSITANDLLADNNVGAFFPNIQSGIFNNSRAQYQIIQNLNADCYSGYMMANNPFNPNVNNLNYFLTDRWNSTIFTREYADIMGGINNLSKLDIRNTRPDFWGIALILEVTGMHRVTDKFGPIPYSQVGKFVINTPYDDQKSIYELFFRQLDTAIVLLQNFINANPNAKPFSKFDLIYGGDYLKWIKYANSLRLRLAMHIVKVSPDIAKQEGEKALKNTDLLITEVSDIAKIAGSGAYENPLYGITSRYNDIRMGASAESILVGLNDPRLPVYFSPATDDAFPGVYKGIRIGSDIPAKPGYNGFSKINTNTITMSSPMILMTPAEVWFLRAEAALRGWQNAGDAQSDYENGINKSFEQWGVSSNTYLEDSHSMPGDYINPKNSDDNSPAVSKVTVKWDTNGSNEVKLEKIVSQKWIAMFPEGQEAWTEFRRTSYPKLFPVVHNNSNGTIDTEIQIRRLAYPATEYTTNPVEIQKGLQFLGGADNGGTRLWWDKDSPNF